jgi:hypothetical protein
MKNLNNSDLAIGLKNLTKNIFSFNIHNPDKSLFSIKILKLALLKLIVYTIATVMFTSCFGVLRIQDSGEGRGRSEHHDNGRGHHDNGGGHHDLNYIKPLNK